MSEDIEKVVDDKKKKEINKEIRKDLFMTLIPCFILLVLNLFYFLINTSYKYWLSINISTGGKLIELAFFYLICLIFLGLFKKGKTAITIVGIIVIVFSIINQLKVSFMAEPILISDVLYLNNTSEIFNIIEGELWNQIKAIIIPVIIELILFIFLIIKGRKLYKNIEIKNIKARILLVIIPVCIFCLLFAPIKFTNKFILNKVFCANKRDDYNSLETIYEYYSHYGILSGMYGQVLENRIQQPDDYDENIINLELSKVENNTNKKFGTPNIIVVFSESFWDIDQLDEIEFNQEITHNFNKLKDEGLFFNMITPSYGGISSNVEYQFLTGSNIMYFNHDFIPYMQFYRDESYYKRPSIIQELRNNNYHTKIVSCASPLLFNCYKAYECMQIDEVEYITDVTEENRKGQYVSDEFVTNKMIKALEEKPKDEKLFYMTLTMQAHMPFSKDKYDRYDVYVTKSNFSQEINDVITSYAQGIYDADKQLGRLYEYVKTFDEPTIIVFYGDHLPYLYSGKENALDKLEFFNTDDKLLNTYRKYNTQSLILANFDINIKDNDTKYLGPDLLSSYILNNMDIEISNYYKWLYANREKIGTANYLITVDNNGNLYNTRELNGEQKRIYNLRRNIEYKLFVK